MSSYQDLKSSAFRVLEASVSRAVQPRPTPLMLRSFEQPWPVPWPTGAVRDDDEHLRAVDPDQSTPKARSTTTG